VGLEFITGVMGSAKTLNLLLRHHQNHGRNKQVIVVMPKSDTRYGVGIVKSKIGVQVQADILLSWDEELEIDFLVNQRAGDTRIMVLVDEAQFLSSRTIESFRRIADGEWVDIYAYGIRTDSRTNLFEGSRRLLELADEVHVLPSDCYYCHRAATFNMRLPEFDSGKQIQLGGEEIYRSVCGPCYSANTGYLDPEPPVPPNPLH